MHYGQGHRVTILFHLMSFNDWRTETIEFHLILSAINQRGAYSFLFYFVCLGFMMMFNISIVWILACRKPRVSSDFLRRINQLNEVRVINSP